MNFDEWYKTWDRTGFDLEEAFKAGAESRQAEIDAIKDIFERNLHYKHQELKFALYVLTLVADETLVERIRRMCRDALSIIYSGDYENPTDFVRKISEKYIVDPEDYA